MSKRAALYIGMMSGTSVDAVDCALIDFSDSLPQIISGISIDIPDGLHQKICTLFEPGNSEIDQLGVLDIEMAHLYAKAVNDLLTLNQLSANDVTAIGCHGQTLRHRPPGTNIAQPFTLQVGDPSTLSAITGIPTVADFRRKDMALGGQGAPLAPAFHAYLCHASDSAVLNIGGIANLSVIGNPLVGYDTGPGNALMDAWCQRHDQGRFDDDGRWAAGGVVHGELLSALLSHSYFKKAPPKSTGKEEFTLTWLLNVIRQHKLEHVSAQDIQATLSEFTAAGIAEAVSKHPTIQRLFICGGGYKNRHLISGIDAKLPGIKLASTEDIGMAPEWMETAVFAWLAKQRIEEKATTYCGVTGATRPAILGGVYLP